MAPSGACLMLDPLGVAEQPPDHRSIKTATTSAGKKVSFWLEEHTTSKGILLLGASCPDTPDPYGGDAIPSFLEVVGVDKGLALLRLRTPVRGVPTDYFVCDIADDDQEVAQRLPQGIYCSGGSVGLLRIVDGSSNSHDQYLVANLRIELDENTEKMEAHLDRWSPYLWDKKWNQQKVDLPFPEDKKGEYMCEWRTDHVVSLGNSLLWFDLWRGILCCSNLLPGGSSEDHEPPKFQYVPLPRLSPEKPIKDAHHRRERPEPFRSVACCQGKLIKLVNLHCPDGDSLEVETWKLGRTMNNDGWSWSMEDTYKYEKLRETFKDKFPPESSLPQWKVKPPCFPVLGTHNSSILYLTLSAQNKAFLVRISVEDKKTVRMAEYSTFCKHRNLLRPVDLSKGNANCTDPTDEWELVRIWRRRTRKNLFSRMTASLLSKR
ncbi:hypothetical protein C2845_PM14G05260 [Panicum miliaceum]|uniref:DUF1618 domain-containing protein n=1 Tax=Panicum miliaceum TaxID=4540 RepID=A0A3L6PQ36_PANMI|nr:hypothetical protein C2845_PM14G05260 [Panicum miliaceum]